MKKRIAFAALGAFVIAQQATGQEADPAQQAEDYVNEMFGPGGPVEEFTQELNDNIEAQNKLREKKLSNAGGTDLYWKNRIVSGAARSGSDISPVFNVYGTGDWSEPVEILVEYSGPTIGGFTETKVIDVSDFKNNRAIFRGPPMCAEGERKEVVSVTATIDPSNKIAEYDEKNNIGSDIYPIFKCGRY